MSKKIHGIAKFDGGRRTPREMHSQFAFKPGERCAACGGPPMTTVTVYGEEQEMLRRDPMLRILMKTNPVKYQQMRQVTKQGPYLRVSRTIACVHCTPELERAAAKHPSWCFASWDYGPKEIPIQVGYGS